MAIRKDLTIKISNNTAALDQSLFIYELDHGIELYFKLMDYKYKYDKDPENILDSNADDILEAYTTIVNPRGWELSQLNGEVIDDTVKFVILDEYTDELVEIGEYKLQVHIKCTHSEFSIPPISFMVLERLKGEKPEVDDGTVDNTPAGSEETIIEVIDGKLQLVWNTGEIISKQRLNAMVEHANSLDDSIKDLSDQMTTKLTNSVYELQNTINTNVSNLQTQINNNKAAIESNDVDIANNRTMIDSNVANIAKNTTAIANNKAAIESNDADIATLDNTTKLHQDEINAIKADIDKLEKIQNQDPSVVDTYESSEVIHETTDGYINNITLSGKTLVNVVDNIQNGIITEDKDFGAGDQFNTSKAELIRPKLTGNTLVNRCQNGSEKTVAMNKIDVTGGNNLEVTGCYDGGQLEIGNIKGKTLVNLLNFADLIAADMGDFPVPSHQLYLTLKPNTKYTLISNTPNSNASGEIGETLIYFNGRMTANNGVWQGSPKCMTTDAEGKIFVALAKNRPYYNEVVSGQYGIMLLEGDYTATPELIPETPFQGMLSCYEPVNIAVCNMVNQDWSNVVWDITPVAYDIDYISSDYIDVSKYVNKRLYVGVVRDNVVINRFIFVCFGDENGTLAASTEYASPAIVVENGRYRIDTGLNVRDKWIIVPPNATKMRLMHQCYAGSITNKYLETDRYVVSTQPVYSYVEAKVPNQIKIKTRGKNLFNKDTALIGHELSGAASSDSIAKNDAWFVTDLVPVIPGEKYINVTSSGGRAMYLYDKDRTWISGFSADNNSVYTIPDDVYYIRTNCRLDFIDNYMIIKSSDSTTFEPYHEQIHTLQLSEPLVEGNEIVYQNGQLGVMHKYRQVHIDDTVGNWAMYTEVSTQDTLFFGELDYKTNTNLIFSDLKARNDHEDHSEPASILCCSSEPDDANLLWLDRVMADRMRWCVNADPEIGVRIPISMLSSPDLNGFYEYMRKNPIHVVYELNNPYFEPLDVDFNLDVFNTRTYIEVVSDVPSQNNFKNKAYTVYPQPATYNLNNIKNCTHELENTRLRLYGNGVKVSNVVCSEGNVEGCGYFDGVLSSFEQENNVVNIKTTGKNLFKGGLVLGHWNNGVYNTNIYSVCTSSIIDVEPYTNYVLTSNPDICRVYIKFNDESEHAFTHEISSADKPTFIFNTSYYTKLVIQCNVQQGEYVGQYDVIGSSIQLERGSVATAYEPYKEINWSLQLNSPLLQFDELIAQDGYLGVMHNSAMYEFTGSEVWNRQQNSKVLLNMYWAGVNNTLSNMNGYDMAMLCDKYVTIENAGVGVPERIEGIQYNKDGSNLLITDMKYDTPAKFINAIKGAKLVYRLETPYFEPITNDPELLRAYENGHLYVTSVVPVSNMGSQELDVWCRYLNSNTDYTVSFKASKAGRITVTLDTDSRTVDIMGGMNTFTLTTSANPNPVLKLSGDNIKISKVMIVSKCENEMDYFEGMRSIGGDIEEINILSCNTPMQFGKGGRIN